MLYINISDQYSDKLVKIPTLYEFQTNINIINYIKRVNKMKYAIISNQKRTILIKRVLKQREPIKSVAEELKIKFPSAKSIIRTYKKTGRVFNKKKSRKAKTENPQRLLVIQQKMVVPKLESQIDNFLQKQEKSQKIQTTNQNSNIVESTNNFWQLAMLTYSQPLLAYSLMPQMAYPQYMQYSSLPFYPNHYPY